MVDALMMRLALAALTVSVMIGCSNKSDFEICVEKMATEFIENQAVSREIAESVAAKQCAKLIYGEKK